MMHLLAAGLASLALAPGCASEGHTVVANRDVRVYFLHSVYACDLLSGRRRKLTDGADGVRLTLALAGRYVAFEDAAGGIVSYDARRNRMRVLDRGAQRLSTIVVTPAGTVAWLRGGEVRTSDGVLDDGASALGVVGRRAYWMSGRRPSSTLLGPPSRRRRAPRSSRSEDCAVRGRTVAANRFVRVFRVDRPRVLSRLYYSCDLGRRRARFLDRNDDGDGLQRIALAGRHIALESGFCDRDGSCDMTFFHVDAVRHRFTRLGRANVPSQALAITRAGAVAWIDRGEVVASDARGLRSLGDRAGALAVAGRRIYWMSDGEAQTARLD